MKNEFCPRWDSNPWPPAFAASVFRFSQFTLFYRVECEELFCKTNIKLKLLKINRYFVNCYQSFFWLLYNYYKIVLITQFCQYKPNFKTKIIFNSSTWDIRTYFQTNFLFAINYETPPEFGGNIYWWNNIGGIVYGLWVDTIKILIFLKHWKIPLPLN